MTTKDIKLTVYVNSKKKKATKSPARWRSKAYSSIKLKSKKQRSSAICDASSPWSCDGLDLDDQEDQKTAEICERDNFLDLLSKVQDNRYDNQRYTLKAGTMSRFLSQGHDNVFDDKSHRNGSEKLMNGQASPWSKQMGIPSVEITGSPIHHRKIHKAASVGSISGLSEDSRSLEEGQASSSGSGKGDGGRKLREDTGESIASPSRKSADALKKVIEGTAPYPTLIDPPDGGFWVQNGEYEAAYGKDGVWRASEISTEHYTIQVDKTSSVYGRYFRTQEHQNFIGRDPKQGPIVASLKMEEDYQGTVVRVIYRTQKETVYKIIPASQMPSRLEPEEYIKIASKMHGEEVSMDKLYPVAYWKAPELLKKFDEQSMADTHKFGVIYQKFGQTCEEELFGNIDHPDSLAEFLDMLGDKVELKGFEGYRGGLDVANNQTGVHSVYTEFKDKKIMFHVSTLLPHDQGDTQYVQKKRHIGNDIVVIIFQEANTPFCPNMIRSHFVHAYIVVQVEHPCTDHTVYKVGVAAQDDVPIFNPPLPDPAIFQKGAEFRDWLLMKALNAEFNCHQAPSFKKLATRTRNQLFLHLIEEIALSVDEVGGMALGRELTASLESSGIASPLFSRNKKRRRTLTGMFGKKDMSLSSPGSPVASTKRRSTVSISPKRVGNRLHADPLTPRHHLLAGSTPDLAEEVNRSGRKEGSQKSIVRKLTFRKHGDGEKQKRTPKRASSVNEPRVFEVRVRGKSSTSEKKSGDSSEESSIASGIGGSVPYDLPGIVDSEGRLGLNTMERSNSALSLRDVTITVSNSKTVDVGIQCKLEGRLSATEQCSSPRLNAANSEHTRRFHSVHIPVLGSPILSSRSLPGTPAKSRKSHPVVASLANDRTFGLTSSGSFTTKSRGLFRNSSFGSRRDFKERKVVPNNSVVAPDLDVFYKVEPVDSVPADPDEMYSSLLGSLQSAMEEVTKLREHNFALIKENVKFASQNRELKSRYLSMKEQLTETQEHIKTLKDHKLKASSSPAQAEPSSSTLVPPSSN